MIIDGMMHLEVVEEFWEGLFEEVIEYYDATGIDIGANPVCVRDACLRLA